jgi:hypothetical protein
MDDEKNPRHLADRNPWKNIMPWLVTPGIIMFILASLIVIMNLGILEVVISEIVVGIFLEYLLSYRVGMKKLEFRNLLKKNGKEFDGEIYDSQWTVIRMLVKTFICCEYLMLFLFSKIYVSDTENGGNIIFQMFRGMSFKSFEIIYGFLLAGFVLWILLKCILINFKLEKEINSEYMKIEAEVNELRKEKKS